MKRGIILLAALAMLAAGCAKAPDRAVPPTPPAKEEAPPPKTETPPPATAEVPGPGQVCLKTDDGSGIKFGMGRPQSDGGYQAGSGWTITWPAVQMLGNVTFARPVDPASVKITVEPGTWVYKELQARGLPENAFAFNIMPAEGDFNRPLEMQQGKEGWITLKVEEARDRSGQPLLSKPATLRVYMYDWTKQDHPKHLTDCQTSLAIPNTSH
ncbi:MAG TPA: hypothetical protein VD902_07530 [Symbiobacteriaceae bacterium]|nr:hypothetical protein [Symbiobacteriaceae bacterium]